MRLVYITCVLLATAICCIAADNAATTQGDTKSINQQTVDLVNSTAPIKNSSSIAAPVKDSVKDSSTNITKNADVKDNITRTTDTIPAATTNITIGNKTKTDTVPDNDHGTESSNSTTSTITSTPTTSSITTKQTPTSEKSTPTTIVTPTTTNNTTPIVSSTPITTPVPSSTKVVPSYTQRHFDGLSFLGGIILATCLMVIGVITWKFYRAFNEQNYRTL